MKRKFIFLILMIFCGVFALGTVFAAENPPQIKLSVQKKTVHVGDDIKVNISLTAPADYEIESADVRQDTIGKFSVRSLKTGKAKAKNKKSISNYRLTLAAYQTGKLKFPALEFLWRVRGRAKWQKIKSKPLTITVASVLTKKSSRDIDTVKPKLKLWILPLLIVLLIILLIAAGLFLLFKFRKKPQNKEAKPEVKLPAHVIAYSQLADIEKDRLIQRALYKEFFERLSSCLRHYIENRFSLRAPLMSTEEFLLRAKKFSALNVEQKALLENFLMLCDLVKFARYGSSHHEAVDSLGTVKEFVEQTKEEPLPEEKTIKKG